MGLVPDRAFRGLLTGLDSERFAAFVAALWAARGYEVHRTDGLVVAERGPEREVLQPVAGGWLSRLRSRPRSKATAVVVAGASAPRWADEDRRVIDAAELREMLLFGVDPDERDRLFERFFDRPPSERPADGVPGASLVGRAPNAIAASFDAAAAAPRRVLGAGGVIVVVALVVLAAAGGGLAGGLGDTGNSGTSTPVGTATGQPPTLQPAATASGPDRAASRYPPGVDKRGVVDPAALLDAHVDTVDDSWYALSVTYRESGSNYTAVARERTRAAGSTNYVTRLNSTGMLRTEAAPVADNEAYADGQTRWVRVVENGSVSYRTGSAYRGGGDRAGEVGFIQQRIATYIQEVLTGAETTYVGAIERDGTTLHRIRFRTKGGPDTSNGSGVLLVDDRGVVRFFRWTYTRSDPKAAIVVEIRHSRFGRVEVTAPEWLEAARNVTGNAERPEGQ